MPESRNSLRHKMFYSASLMVLMISLIFFSLPVVRQFLIIDFKSGRVLYSADIKAGDKFSIIYIHSVNKSPIEDQFIIDSNYNIVLQKSIFKSFGAGVPSNPADGGRFEFFKDRIEVADINRKIGNLLLYVGVIADHHFLIDGKDIKLNELSSPQRSVQFLIEKITVYQYLKYSINKNGRS